MPMRSNFNKSPQVLSVQHLLAAVFRAVNDLLHSRLKSRNVHSEIVFSLSPNNNVGSYYMIPNFLSRCAFIFCGRSLTQGIFCNSTPDVYLTLRFNEHKDVCKAVNACRCFYPSSPLGLFPCHILSREDMKHPVLVIFL